MMWWFPFSGIPLTLTISFALQKTFNFLSPYLSTVFKGLSLLAVLGMNPGVHTCKPGTLPPTSIPPHLTVLRVSSWSSQKTVACACTLKCFFCVLIGGFWVFHLARSSLTDFQVICAQREDVQIYFLSSARWDIVFPEVEVEPAFSPMPFCSMSRI